MSVQKFAIASFAKLATYYKTSRQNISLLYRKYGDAILNPDELFTRLLTHSTESPLRRMLSDPGERARITKEISKP
jgi:hypothetical protein